MIDTTANGKPTSDTIFLKDYKFNSLINGSGYVSLEASDKIDLKGNNAQDDGLYSESYAIRVESEFKCYRCDPRAQRYFDTDFNLKAPAIELSTNWGAVFMEATQYEDKDENDEKVIKQFFAHTTMDAETIKIRASGSLEDKNAYATFKAVSHNDKADKDAQIKLTATKEISVDYEDGLLDKVKNQDLFYSEGNASIEISAPLIVINNNYKVDEGLRSADVRSAFHAEDNSRITLTGKAAVTGNTIGRDKGNVVLNLEDGSVLTGAVFDDSFPYYDTTAVALNLPEHLGSVTINGTSAQSVWNVRPFYDEKGRGDLFKKPKPENRSTVDILRGNSKANPFYVNLAGNLAFGTPESSSDPHPKVLVDGNLPYQTLNVTNLKPENGTEGYVEFILRFNDQKGRVESEKEDERDGWDAVQIFNGAGSHGIYVKYVG